MTRSATETTVPPVAHEVVWFAPDRPVEGNTINVRPLAVDESEDSADRPATG